MYQLLPIKYELKLPSEATPGLLTFRFRSRQCGLYKRTSSCQRNILICTKFLNDLDLEECSIYGFKRRIQLKDSHGHWHPYQQGKTNLLIQTNAGVLGKKECVNLLPFITQMRIGMTVNDRARFCAQIPSQLLLITMVKLS